jgi:hypothetical protein
MIFINTVKGTTLYIIGLATHLLKAKETNPEFRYLINNSENLPAL